MGDDEPCGEDRCGEHASETVSDGGQSTLERTLRALTHSYSRYVCYYLVDNEPADFEECVDAVANRKTSLPTDAVPDEQRKSIQTKLYHSTLPKLADLGIIEYDQRSGVIRYRNPPPYFETFLRLAREMETS